MVASAHFPPPPPLRILLLSATPWHMLERLPLLFHEAGFDIAAISVQGTGLDLVPWKMQRYWPTDKPADTQLDTAIEAFKPHLLILQDELSIRLVSMILKSNPGNFTTRHDALLERSFGCLASFHRRGKRDALNELADCIRIPDTIAPCSTENLLEFGNAAKWNCVLKTEGSTSGAGVSRCETESAFRENLQRLTRNKAPFVIQRFVHGRNTMRNVAALRGKVLCGLSLEAIEINRPYGYATVVKTMPHAGMDDATAQVAATWGISGFFSCDFVIDADNVAWLVEVNARPTTVMHLGRCMGVDFAQAAADIANGVIRVQAERTLIGGPVALFPKEWQRSPDSPWLTTAENDIPWNYPGLISLYETVLHDQQQNNVVQ